MIKILSYLFSYFAGRYNSILKPSTFMIIDQLLVRARKLLMTSSIMFISSLLLAGGVIISLLEFTSQIDRFAMVWPSATLVGGLSLSGISLAVLIFAFTSRSFDLRYVRSQKTRRQESLFDSHTGRVDASTQRAQSPLEEALSVLIMDFVNERKQNREQQSASVKEEASPTMPPKPTRTEYENTTLQ